MISDRQRDALRAWRDSHDRRDFGLNDDGSATAFDGKDWKLLRVYDYGPGECYRFRVEGLNLNASPGEYGYEFSWRVRDVSDYRFDLSDAVYARVR